MKMLGAPLQLLSIGFLLVLSQHDVGGMDEPKKLRRPQQVVTRSLSVGAMQLATLDGATPVKIDEKREDAIPVAAKETPVANDDSTITTPQNTPVVVNVLENDIGEGELTVQDITGLGPTYGQAGIQDDNTIVYTPKEEYCGVDEFGYEVIDVQERTDTATVTVTVLCDHPVAVDDIGYKTDQNKPVRINVLENDRGQGEIAINDITIGPAHGKAEIDDDDERFIIYTPTKGFCGGDSFAYNIEDDNFELLDEARVSITVVCDDQVDGPVAKDDPTITTPQNTPVVVNVLKNDIGEGELTVQDNTGPGPTYGEAEIQDDNTIVYTPKEEYCGVDVFDYEIIDVQERTDTATVTVAVLCDRPVAVDDIGYKTDQNAPVRINVLENDRGQGEIAINDITIGPAHGKAEIDDDDERLVIYTPKKGFCGGDSFAYNIEDDSFELLDEARVSITVVCDGPVANDDSYSMVQDTVLSIENLLDNDEGVRLKIRRIAEQPFIGDAVTQDDNSVTYEPDAGFCGGKDFFVYEIEDEDGNTDTATVTVEVSCINKGLPPEAEDDSAFTEQNSPVKIPVLDNDSDPNGGELVVEDITAVGPSNGRVGIGEDNTITYSPEPGFCGIDAFGYQIINDAQGVDTATVTVIVDCGICGPDFCQNGAACVSEEGSPACACLEGFVGVNCETRSADPAAKPDPDAEDPSKEKEDLSSEKKSSKAKSQQTNDRADDSNGKKSKRRRK